MSEGSIRIGAAFDKAELEAQLNAGASAVVAATNRMTTGFTELQSVSASAFARISEDTKAAAISVSSDYARIAVAQTAFKSAQADVRAAALLVAKAEGEDVPKALALLAAAQERATLTAQMLAKAQLEVAEVAGTSAFSLSGFAESAMKIFGTVLAAGFAVETINEFAKLNLELEHLSVKTGIAVQELAGLRLIANESNVDWEKLTIGMVKMEKAIKDATDGSKKQVEGFHELGISQKEVIALSGDSEAMLNRLGKGFQETHSSATRAHAAISLLGKGGAEFIPVFVQYGDQLGTVAKRQGALTGITEESVRASAEWMRTTADLSASIHASLAPALTILTDALNIGIASFKAIAMIGHAAFLIVQLSIDNALNSLQTFGALFVDIATGNIAKFKTDFVGAMDRNKAITDETTTAIKEDFNDIGKTWDELQRKLSHPSTPETKDPDTGTSPKGTTPAPVSRISDDYTASLKVAALSQQELINLTTKLGATWKTTGAEVKTIIETGAKASITALQQNKAMTDEDLQFQIQAAQIEYEAKKKADDDAVKHGKLTHDEALAEEKIYRTKVYELQRQAIERKIAFLNANDPETPLKRQTLYNQLLLLEKKFHADEAALEQKHVSDLKQSLNQMSSAFGNAFAQWATGAEAFGQSMAHMFQGIVGNLVKMVVEMGIQWAIAQATHEKFAMRQVFVDAKTAASSAFKYYSGIAPEPVPAIMATLAFVGTMAAGAFAQGGIVPGFGGGDTFPAMLTPGEMVLPPQLSSGLQNMIAGGGGQGGGSLTYAPTIQALDGPSVARVLRNNLPALQREFTRLQSNGLAA